MPHALDLPDSITSRTDLVPPAFVCSWTDGGEDAACIRVPTSIAVVGAFRVSSSWTLVALSEGTSSIRDR